MKRRIGPEPRFVYADIVTAFGQHLQLHFYGGALVSSIRAMYRNAKVIRGMTDTEIREWHAQRTRQRALDRESMA